MITRERACITKARFVSRSIAKAYAKKARRKYGTTLNVYACRFCSGFHLTKGSRHINAPVEKVVTGW